MQFLKAILVTASFTVFILIAVIFHVVIGVIIPSWRWYLMAYLTRILIKILTVILGIKVTLLGELQNLKAQGSFIIARHIGYLDGLILGSLFPANLISKKDIQKWPGIGIVVTISGTVFVDRLRKNKVSESLEQMAGLLKNKTNVVVFPEGTSTDGSVIRPFQTVFFQAPISAGSDILPVTISYLAIDGNKIEDSNRNNICWYGQVSFFKHLWALFCFRSIEVTVKIHKKIETKEYTNTSQDRKKLAQICYDVVCEASGVKAAALSLNGNDNGNGSAKEEDALPLKNENR